MCNGRKFKYYLGEVLQHDWAGSDPILVEKIPDTVIDTDADTNTDVDSVTEANSLTTETQQIVGGDGEGGDTDQEEPVDLDNIEINLADDEERKKSTFTAKAEETQYTEVQFRFVFFKINATAIVPFLEFWLWKNPDGVYTFPTYNAKIQHSEGDEDGEEDQYHFYSAMCAAHKHFGLLDDDDICNTAFIEENPKTGKYHGYLKTPSHPNAVYIFQQLHPDAMFVSSAVTEFKTAILDEIINKRKLVTDPISPEISQIFYENHKLLYIYGPPVNPIDTLIYGLQYDGNFEEEAAQEIPYCLYLCKDKQPFEQEELEGKAVETTIGKALGVEDQHYISPKDKYELLRYSAEVKHKKTFNLRSEDEYGLFFYFTDTILDDNTANYERYAVFVYNTKYVLDQATNDILKDADTKGYLTGGEQLKEKLDWKTNFLTVSEKAVEMGQEKQNAKLSTEEILKKNSTELEEEETVDEILDTDIDASLEENNDMRNWLQKIFIDKPTADVEDNLAYASVYFQRDKVPLWCIKHRICFTVVGSQPEN